MKPKPLVLIAPGIDRPEPWVDTLVPLLPECTVRAWSVTECDQADYVVLWNPPTELFASQHRLKAIFNLGAGVDSLLSMANLPAKVPLVRLEDVGMAAQMAEYVAYAALRFYRGFEIYEQRMREGLWKILRPPRREDFPIGVMGLGVIGARVATTLTHFDFPVQGWSRSAHHLPGVRCYAGAEGLDAFLRATRVLVCVLPLTPQTENLLNARNLGKLLPDAYLINVARGRHVVDDDLLALLDSGHLAGATLDVFRTEPLPSDHGFWRHPKITMTPHISARTLRTDSLKQIADNIRKLERGETLTTVVDRDRGY